MPQGQVLAAKVMTPDNPAMVALGRLKEGNARFRANVRGVDALLSQVHRAGLATAQKPFAIVLGCSDSRVPAELVFDQGLGDLFVIRVAGNIVAPSQVGSVEFAAERFGTPLVVVLGHTSCGAVQATLELLAGNSPPGSRDVMSIVQRIRPALETIPGARSYAPPAPELLNAAVRANVRAAANHLRHGSEVLERLVRAEKLLVVGAEYDLSSGEVEFFDGVPS